MQAFSESQQLETGGRNGVLAGKTYRDGELIVGTGLTLKAQRLVGQGEVIIDKILELAGVVARFGGPGGRFARAWLLEALLFRQNEHLLGRAGATRSKSGP